MFSRVPAAIEENFRFLILDVTKQLEDLRTFLAEPEPKLYDRINGRDDYIDNMKGLIEDRCFQLMAAGPVSKKDSNFVRSLTTITSNLERIGDFVVNVAGQAPYLTDPRFLLEYDMDSFLDEVEHGLDLVVPALAASDLSQAFRICQTEFQLDHLFKVQFDKILAALATGRQTGDLVTTLFIIRYFERMGDSLLNIGEAVIFSALGEKLKIHQYQALTENLAQSGLESPISEVEFESIWGSRSGCRIGSVQGGQGDRKGQPAIFKEGNAKKLREEKDNIARWEALFPGLPPKVFSFQEHEGNASILLEFLPGCTLQQVLLNAGDDTLQNALYLLEETCGTVWEQTLGQGPVKAGFLAQLERRLPDIYRVHPQFAAAGSRMGDVTLPSMAEQLGRLKQIEAQLPAPFSVFIHGDCNVNNIIYDHKEQRLHFLDLHRSCQNDYIQDVSVFMVSNFRIPFPDQAVRQRLNQASLAFAHFAARFAQKHQDGTFAARLALGLARSFFTSTRFELHAPFARTMYLRARYLMDRLLEHQGLPWEDFRLNEDILVL